MNVCFAVQTSASVSRWKSRLKERLMQTEESLFANGGTPDEVVGNFG